jgi:hypothetical protein
LEFRNQMKKCKHYISIVFLMTSTIIHSQGLKIEANKAERYVEASDNKVGLTTIDSAQNLVWMRCVVGQEFDSAGTKACSGKAEGVTFTEAIAFSKKIGNGWRIPTLWEIQGSKVHVMKALAMGKTEAPGKYGGGGWDCVGLGVWTTTGVEGQPNQTNMAKCAGIMTGNDIKREQFDRFGDSRALLIMVRSN